MGRKIRSNVSSVILASIVVILAINACSGGTGNTLAPGPHQPQPITPQSVHATIPLSDVGTAIALPSLAGYAESITLTSNSAQPGTNLNLTISTNMPKDVPAMPPDFKETQGFLYFAISSSKTVTLNGFPGFTLTIPPGLTWDGGTLHLGFYDPNRGWQEIGDVSLSGRTMTFTPTRTPLTLKAGVRYIVVPFACVEPSPTPTPNCTTVPLATGTELPIPPLGGISGNWIAGTNDAPAGTTVRLTTYLTPPAGAPSPVARSEKFPFLAKPPVNHVFVTSQYQAPDKAAASSSTGFTFDKFPAITFDLPSTVPTSGVTFKLETFNLTTGELLDVETGSVVLTGSKASAVGAGAIVSFPGTKSPFNPKYADTYIWELVSESTEIGGTFKEYSLAAGSVPTQIVEGPDGNMWFTEQGANKIGRMTPTGGLTEYSVAGADPGGLPWGIVVGPDNNLWFTEFCFTGNTCGEIGRISTTGTMKLFPAAPGTPALNDPLGITLGPDRNLWFTDAGTGNIGYSTVSGAIKQFSVVTPKLDALKFITAGPDGNLWFTEEAYDKIGRITTSGIAKEYSVPTANAMPNGIVASGNLFFAEYAAGKIGDSTPAGSITEYTVPVKSNPQYLIVGPDSNIWFTDGLTNALGRLDLTTKLIEETAPVPTAAANPLGIASGPGGTIWFTEFNANKIGVFTPL